ESEQQRTVRTQREIGGLSERQLVDQAWTIAERHAQAQAIECPINAGAFFLCRVCRKARQGIQPVAGFECGQCGIAPPLAQGARRHCQPLTMSPVINARSALASAIASFGSRRAMRPKRATAESGLA